MLTGCKDKGFQKPLLSHPVNTGYCSYSNKVIHRKAVSEIERVLFNNRPGGVNIRSVNVLLNSSCVVSFT